MRFLNEQDGNKLLSSYGISMIPSFICENETDAKVYFNQINANCVMKILSSDILHKSDAGAVKLGIKTEEEALAAYHEILKNAKAYDPTAKVDGVLIQRMLDKGLEIIFGVKKDAQFGHVVLFGMGGIYVEILKDVSMRLVPLTRKDAEALISETKISGIFDGFRGPKYNKEEVIDTLLKLSRIIEENPDIEEIDVNPYILYPDGAQGYGVDALIAYDEPVIS